MREDRRAKEESRAAKNKKGAKIFPITCWQQEHKSKMMIIRMLRRCRKDEGEVGCGAGGGGEGRLGGGNQS